MNALRRMIFWDRFSERERKLMGLAAVFLAAFAVFLAVFWIQTGMSSLSEENDRNAEILMTIEQKKGDLIRQIEEERKTEQMSASPPPPLRSMLSNIAKGLSMTIPELKELPDQLHGDRWVEHVMEVRLKQMDLQSSVQFMVEVEASRKSFPIAITRLEMIKRRGHADEFDVKMAVSTYERKADAGKNKAPSSPGADETGLEEDTTETGSEGASTS